PKRWAMSPPWWAMARGGAWRPMRCASSACSSGLACRQQKTPGQAGGSGARRQGLLVLLLRYAGLLEQVGPLRHLLLNLGVERLGVGIVVEHFGAQTRHALLELRI